MNVGGIPIKARIDSGAEITILSSKIFEKFSKQPTIVKKVVMQMADYDAVLQGFIVKPVQMKLGSQVFKERLYVAPITDDMLLGHDILHHLGVLLDLQTDTLILKDERIPLTTSFKEGKPVIGRVSINKRTVVPPNSTVRLSCQLSTTFQEDYCIEPMSELSF